MISVALPKGRLGSKVFDIFEKIGYDCDEMHSDSRQLIFTSEENGISYFLVKPSDVSIYVEHGAADIGIVGKDILLEYEPDVYELLDLNIGKCNMCVAGKNDFKDNPDVSLRVATKFVNIAKTYYKSINRDIEIIKLNGSIELAPILNLSDVIVDIVETGTTLKENNLSVLTKIIPISARLIANKASYKFKTDEIQNITFIKDYISLNDEKVFIDKMYNMINKKITKVTKKEIKIATKNAFIAYKEHLSSIRTRGQDIIDRARKNHKPIIVLAGRPYHVDPGINHGIDKLIVGMDVACLNEESISHLVAKFKTNVMNQWTYHARLYAAAKYIAQFEDMNLIQLVSFGCGLDAITSDETRLLLESEGKIYTQIKIDEITNLGAVKIRLRSLLEALKERGEKDER